ncbi:hypothetical protein ACFQMH_23140 [Streptomyces viridiviolaceus]|uniref:Uncharacterized protein n=1 Tax=Streptomyces viridiviolaceus TaxID=68282 RepID=A0ABW2E676_9ACTN|nr:hypothetical protein [Streptomyces viridiviolaceus]
MNLQSGTARLLPWLIDDRTHGPLFLTDRRAPDPRRRRRHLNAHAAQA